MASGASPLLSTRLGRVPHYWNVSGRRRKLYLLTVTLNFLRCGINIEMKDGITAARMGGEVVGERIDGLGFGGRTGSPLREETRPSPLCQTVF